MNPSKITIKTTGPWRMYWTGPLPQNATAIGTVTRSGYDTGALMFIRTTGLYVQGNAGALRSLPQRDIIIGLHMAEVGAKGGSATSPAKTQAVQRNAKLGGRPVGQKDKTLGQRAAFFGRSFFVSMCRRAHGRDQEKAGPIGAGEVQKPMRNFVGIAGLVLMVVSISPCAVGAPLYPTAAGILGVGLILLAGASQFPTGGGKNP